MLQCLIGEDTVLDMTTVVLLMSCAFDVLQ